MSSHEELEMPTHREVVAVQVRALVADVYGWSRGNTKEGTRLNHYITGRHELTQRIHDEIGVEIKDAMWPHFINVGMLIEFVHSSIAEEYVAS